MNSWAEISEHHLTRNYRALERIAGPDIPVLAVIKSDAYGHSAELCAPPLARAGASWLGVSDAPQGTRVRRALSTSGIPPAKQPDILLMCGHSPEDAATILEDRLTPVLWNPDQIAALEEAARGTNARVNVHLELDSGMSRQGVDAGPVFTRTLTLLVNSRYLRLSGVFSHLASAEISRSTHNRDQLATLRYLIAAIRHHGLRPEWMHVGNTSTIYSPNLFPEPPHAAPPLAWLREFAATLGARPMLHSGLALYGALPLEPLAEARLDPHLHPVLSWKTRIRSLSEICYSASVGYNATFRASRPMRLALLPVGYADGLRRELSASNIQPGGWTMIHGRRVPIVGRISMNLTTVDVTDMPDASLGDIVTLLGPGISAEAHATLANTIPCEILCGLRPDTRHLTDSPSHLHPPEPPQ